MNLDRLGAGKRKEKCKPRAILRAAAALWSHHDHATIRVAQRDSPRPRPLLIVFLYALDT